MNFTGFFSPLRGLRTTHDLRYSAGDDVDTCAIA